MSNGVIKMLNKKIIKTDLCVIGGGMAGICAAIAADRLC